MKADSLLLCGSASILLLTALTGCPQGSFTFPDTASTSSDSSTAEPTETGPELCGNTVCDPGEPDSCPGDCAGCGNGVVDGAEQCDDGNADDTDECTASCLEATCGDGHVQAGVELCDDGENSDADWTPVKQCKAGCQAYSDHCGDGTCQPEHEDLESCPADPCAAVCGDGLAEGDEPCDDGNDINTDECLDDCVLATCGDGIVHAGVEDCDDADADNTDNCLDTCAAASCGDGFVQDGVEECDDGNAVDVDKCSNECRRPRRVFVTSTFFSGNLGGLLGADLKCQTLAEQGGLDGVFKAWLSDDDDSPVTRFDTGFTGSYRLVGGVLVANGWADLTDGTLAHAIDRDQIGKLTQGVVWTNTRPDGVAVIGGKNCTGWQSAMNDALNKPTVGVSEAVDSTWTQFDLQACSSKFSIYCFEDI